MRFTPIHYGFYEADFFIARHDHINYFEALISPEGEITYACPSHQRAMIRYTGLSEQEIWQLIDANADVLIELIRMTKLIPVYTAGYLMCPDPTDEQLFVLEKLIDRGLVKKQDLTYWY